MKRSYCPRCNEPIPNKHPVHLICFIERASYLLIGAFFLLLIGIAIIAYL